MTVSTALINVILSLCLPLGFPETWGCNGIKSLILNKGSRPNFLNMVSPILNTGSFSTWFLSDTEYRVLLNMVSLSDTEYRVLLNMVSLSDTEYRVLLNMVSLSDTEYGV
jgi:hypothetical protein